MAIGSVVGGIGSLIAAHQANKQAERAGKTAEKWLKKGWEEANEAQDLADNYSLALKDYINEYGDLANQRWQDWENTYGSLEDNLVNYYTNLDPKTYEDKYSTMWRADIEHELNKQFKQFRQTAAQTGLLTTGMLLQAQKEKEFKQAKMNVLADIEAENRADDLVRGAKTQFYMASVLPEKHYAQALQENAINNKVNWSNLGLEHQIATRNFNVNLATQNSSMYSQSATGYGTAAGQLFGQGMNMLNRGFAQWQQNGALGGMSNGIFGGLY